jgi:hypothetical protein
MITMLSSMKIFSLGASLLVSNASAFSIEHGARTRPSTTQLELERSSSRRGFLAGSVASVASFTLLVGPPAVADVSDGNQLPDGAAQFSRLLNTKMNISTLRKRILNKDDPLTKKDWDNVGQFLRRLYQASEDMKSISISIYDPEKKKAAVATIEEVKKYSKAGEASVNDQDAQGITVVLDKVDSIFAEFLDLLRDIPDEI